MREEIFNKLLITQDRIVHSDTGVKKLERRPNPYNPLTHVIIIIAFILYLVIDLVRGLYKNLKEFLDYKYTFRWEFVEILPIDLISKKFYKEQNGDWFIHLPEYIEQGGTKAELQMVCGADTMLDVLSQGGDAIRVVFAVEDFAGCKYQLHLERVEIIGEQEEWGVYKGLGLDSTYPEIETVMLCPVTKFVFNGDFPKVIYVG